MINDLCIQKINDLIRTTLKKKKKLLLPTTWDVGALYIKLLKKYNTKLSFYVFKDQLKLLRSSHGLALVKKVSLNRNRQGNISPKQTVLFE